MNSGLHARGEWLGKARKCVGLIRWKLRVSLKAGNFQKALKTR